MGDIMQKFERKPEYDLSFATCVFSGILNEIYFEIKHGTKDRTEELQYLVDRYCEEFIISGNYLQEKMKEYALSIKNKELML